MNRQLMTTMYLSTEELSAVIDSEMRVGKAVTSITRTTEFRNDKARYILIFEWAR